MLEQQRGYRQAKEPASNRSSSPVEVGCLRYHGELPYPRSLRSQFLKKPNYLASGHSFAEQISLNLNAAFEVQTSHLIYRLDTFGGGDHAKTCPKPRDGADDREASLVDEQVAHK